MSRLSSALATNLAKRCQALETARSRMEQLSANGLLRRKDIELAYEALFLSAFSAFEAFLEDLFLGLLVKGQGLRHPTSSVNPRVDLRSYVVARDVVIGTNPRDFVDWLPYDNTLRLANAYFRGGRPFSTLAPAQLDLLNKCRFTRNAIAHKSQDTFAKFERHVIGANPLPPSERRPSGYLRGNLAIAPPRTRYENFIAELVSIARILAG